MATMITDECIACGACEDECPTTAIRLGDDIFMIDAERCTECVGFHVTQQCAAACPLDCCVPDPDRRETEEILLARAKDILGSRADGLYASGGASCRWVGAC